MCVLLFFGLGQGVRKETWLMLQGWCNVVLEQAVVRGAIFAYVSELPWLDCQV
jgi:hypothetical protein